MALPTIQEAARHALMDPLQVERTETSANNLWRALNGRSAVFPGATDEQLWPTDGSAVPDPERVIRSLERDRDLLRQHDPRPLAESMTSLEKAKCLKAAESLIERIQEGMPNDEQMRIPTAQNVDLHMRWEARNLDNILALKHYLRRLDPHNDDPHFLSVERFRPIKPAKYDWKAFHQNFDQIAWKQELIDELEPLDEDRFRSFCMYKAADWSEASIRRELELTESQYAQAMQRLHEVRDRMISGSGTPSERSMQAFGARTADGLAPPFSQSPSTPEPPHTPPEDDEAGHLQALLKWGEQAKAGQTEPIEPPEGKAFGTWLNRELDQRQLIKARFADQIGTPRNAFHTYLRGQRAMAVELRQTTLETLAAYDGGDTALQALKRKEEVS